MAREADGRTTDLSFGIKLWSTDPDLLPHALKLIEEGSFHYIELTVVPGTDVGPFATSGARFVVHCASDRNGLNIGDPSRLLTNLELMGEAIQWADDLGAEYIVVHPGWGSMEAAMDLLGRLPDPRYLIENMPKVGMDGEDMIGHSPEQLTALMCDVFGFCFDLNHAVKAATALALPIPDLLSRFASLGPSILHIADGMSAVVHDEHLDIGAGDYDFRLLAGILLGSRAKMVTLETGRRAVTGLEDDVRNLAALRDLITRHGPHGEVERRPSDAPRRTMDCGDAR